MGSDAKNIYVALQRAKNGGEWKAHIHVHAAHGGHAKELAEDDRPGADRWPNDEGSAARP